jgi:hypothetical protein
MTSAQGAGASATYKPRPCGPGWFVVNLQIALNFKEYHLYLLETSAAWKSHVA